MYALRVMCAFGTVADGIHTAVSPDGSVGASAFRQRCPPDTRTPFQLVGGFELFGNAYDT